MNKENLLLLSLDDKNAKNIANVINNKTSKKILNHLAEIDSSTETKIAKELNLPISSIHYNLEQLQKAKLVNWEKYHYSKKGREIKHYKLASKYIIIVPKKDKEGILEKLKMLFPVFLTIIFTTSFIYWINKPKEILSMNTILMEKTIPSKENFEMIMVDSVSKTIIKTTTIYSEPWFWFILGSLLTISIILLISLKKDKK